MKDTTTTYSIRWTSWWCSHFDETHATVKKYMAIMTTRRHADISDFSPKSFTYPTPKYPPRRNGLDWHGLQRCGNHWDIFVFPPRRQKAPHRSNRVSSSATQETMKRMAFRILWRRCGKFEELKLMSIYMNNLRHSLQGFIQNHVRVFIKSGSCAIEQ